MAFLSFIQILRNFILGAKYGYLSEERHYLLKNSKIGKDILAN